MHGSVWSHELVFNPKISAPISHRLGLEFPIIGDKNFEAIITLIHDSTMLDM